MHCYSVSIFMTTFIYMERQWLCPHALATVTSLATLLFYFFNSLLFGERSCDEHLHRTCKILRCVSLSCILLHVVMIQRTDVCQYGDIHMPRYF